MSYFHKQELQKKQNYTHKMPAANKVLAMLNKIVQNKSSNYFE